MSAAERYHAARKEVAAAGSDLATALLARGNTYAVARLAGDHSPDALARIVRQFQELSGESIYPPEIQRGIGRLTLALDSWFAASVEVAEVALGAADVLRTLEWSADHGACPTCRACRRCAELDGGTFQGHRDGCALSAALGATQ